MDVLEIVLLEMYVEKAIVAQEILQHSPQTFKSIKESIGNSLIETVPHVEFKKLTKTAVAVIRTGEFTPYANVILVAGAWGFSII